MSKNVSKELADYSRELSFEQDYLLLHPTTRRIDSTNATKMGEVLDAAIAYGNTSLLLFRATNLDYMSSAGTRELLSAQTKMVKKGGVLVVLNPSLQIREALDFPDVHEMFPILTEMPASAVAFWQMFTLPTVLADLKRHRTR